MNDSTCKRLVCAALLGMALPVLAQAIAVTTPRLPPRTDGPGAAAAARPGGQPAPAAAQPAAYANATSPGAGPAVYYGAPAAAPAAAVTPQRAAAGACRAQPTPDRQTLMLVSGAEALARAHLPLGEFRAQQVVHSPDGRWAVAYTKLRGAAQYAAMTIDLERCELQRVIELSAPGEDASFDGENVVLRWSGGERRVGLRDGSVR